LNINGTYAQKENLNLHGLSAGINFGGRVDVSFEYASDISNKDEFRTGSFSLGLLVIKEHVEKIPFSFGFGFLSQKTKYTNALTTRIQSPESQANFFYLNWIKRLYKSEDFNYYLGFNKGFGKYKLNNNSTYSDVKYNSNQVFLTIHSKKSFVYLKPSLAYISSKTKELIFQTSFGMIW